MTLLAKLILLRQLQGPLVVALNCPGSIVLEGTYTRNKTKVHWQLQGLCFVASNLHKIDDELKVCNLL